jgi:cysteine synthase/biotin carboxylase
MTFDSVLDAVGHTPLVRLRASTEQAAVYAKLEMQNPFAMKDRVAKHIVLEAKKAGILPKGAPIVESSSGTMALGLALVGQALGHPVRIVTDPRIDPLTLAKLHALGAEVDIVQAMGANGWQGARLDRLDDIRKSVPSAFWPRQYSNSLNPLAYSALAQELLADLGEIDVLVGAVGSGGSLCGTARALRRALLARDGQSNLRVIAVDAVGSVLFGQPDQPSRKQSGLGNSIVPRNLDRGQVDRVHWLNDHEAFAATRELAHREGLFAGNSSGSVFRVMSHLATQAQAGSRIVGIFPDRGDRYTESIYSDDYWRAHELDHLPLHEEPREVSYGVAVHGWSAADVPPAVPNRLLFIESNTSGTGMLALERALEAGFTPVLFTSDVRRYPTLRNLDCEIAEVDTNDIDALRRGVESNSFPNEVAGILSTSEFYQESAAILAAERGLPGNPPEAVAACRDKSITRRLLSEAGLAQPLSIAVADPVEVPDAIALTGLPCVVKPAAESASTGVLLCTTLDEALSHVRRLLAIGTNSRGQQVQRKALVEQFVDGAEFSVEVLLTGDTTEVVGITSKTVSGPPNFVELRHVFPAQVDEAEADALSRAACTALRAVGLNNGVSHVEVRLASIGPVIIEINPRPAGGMIPEAIRLAGGPELLELQLEAATTGVSAFHADSSRWRPSGIAFITSAHDGELRGVQGVDAARCLPGIVDIALTREMGAAVRTPTDAYDRIGHVLATAASVDELNETLDAALQFIHVDVLAREDLTQS